MLRKCTWAGIVLGLIPLYMGAACGGYIGWPGLSTSGVDAKVTEELSVSSINPLESGLFTYYVNYNNISAPGMKTVSTYIDHTAPFGVFTSDGLFEQHFNDHVGVEVAAATDRNGDGVICWIGCPFEAGDYTIPNAFCPALGGTGGSDASAGFQAYCKKGQWETIVASGFFEETKQTVPGSKFSNAIAGNFSPTVLAPLIASSTPIPKTGGVTATVTGLSLPNGASHTLASPASANLYGFANGVAINADQPGLIEAASWLAGQWAGQPDAAANVTVSFNGGAASLTFTVPSGNTASIVMQNYAATH
jgi:hypothetical protein